jgi:predicted nuclease of predicted toxin-antitoxin system
MKFLFDQNISHRILKILPNEFEGSSTVKKEELTNANDKTIWEYAKLKSFIIVTQDSDFNDFSTFFGCPPKIIWLRAGNLSSVNIKELLFNNIKDINEFIQNKDFCCFEIYR